MDEIVERTLELAREGRTVGETEPVRLAEVAEQSWQVVETESAELRVEDDVAVEADPSASSTSSRTSSGTRWNTAPRPPIA